MIGYQFNVTDIKKLQRYFNAVAQGDTLPLMQTIGAVVTASAQERITDTNETPDGEPWADLTPYYAEQKAEQRAEAGLLQFDGDLLDSISFDAEPEQVTIGSNLPYAGYQGEMREYIGISQQDSADIADAVDDWFKTLLNANKGMLQ